MEQPMLYEIKGGWAARGLGWAVHAPSREEVLRKFEEAEREHDRIREQPQPKSQF